MKDSSRLNSWLRDDDRPVSVDVFCVVYNHEQYLRLALEGMLMQKTDFPVRVVLHDDASTDGSADIIREYQRRYPDRIVAVLEDENLYQNGGSIWRRMLPFITAKYVAYCEGDDCWIDETKLQRQVDYLERHPDCIAVYHNILPVNELGEHDESLRGCYPILAEGDYTEREIREFGLKTQTASLVHRNFDPHMDEVERTFLANVGCNGDNKLLIVCGLLGRVHILPDVMAAHRRVFERGDSYTARRARLSDRERFRGDQDRYVEMCRLYNHYSKKKVHPYNHVLGARLAFRTRMFASGQGLGDRTLDDVHVPYYAYVTCVPYLTCRLLRLMKRKTRRSE